MDTFDYLIVGAGSAGAVLARRLVDSGATVCLLESGGADSSPFVHLPAGFVKTLLNGELTWRYKTEGSAGSNARRIPMVHGRMLGGTSSVNGMVYVRGQAADYDGWAAQGNPGWAYRDVLPYFKRIERRIGWGDDNFRGRSGPVPVTDSNWRHPLCDAFIDGAHELGVPHNPDFNGASQEGAGYYQRNIRRWRYSTARAYLKPVLRHPKLDVRLRAHATAVLLEGRRAVGVRYVRGDVKSTPLEVRAREVILCAGALATPRLLQISGIGPGPVLQGIGVAVQHALPGVGENLRDHYSPRIIVRARPGIDTINSIARGPRLAGEVLKWLVGLPSVLGVSAAISYAFCKSDSAEATPDMAIIYTPGSYKDGILGLLDDFPGMTCGGWQLRPQSSGYVRARSPDPFQLPGIQPNYLQHPTDQKVAVASLRMARRILATPAMAAFCETELAPGADTLTDEALLEHARRTGTTCCHAVGTCRMGPASDPGAVVDAELRVHGLQGLRVVDASIMPMITSGNTNAPTMMIAEKAADMILGRSATA